MLGRIQGKGRAQDRSRYEPSPHLSIGILLLPAAAYGYTGDNKEEPGWGDRQKKTLKVKVDQPGNET